MSRQGPPYTRDVYLTAASIVGPEVGSLFEAGSTPWWAALAGSLAAASLLAVDIIRSERNGPPAGQPGAGVRVLAEWNPIGRDGLDGQYKGEIYG